MPFLANLEKESLLLQRANGFPMPIFRVEMKAMKTNQLLIFLILLFSQATWAGFSVQGEDLLTGQKVETLPKGRGLVVTFLSARCPCSNSHVPLLKKLSQEFPEFQFLAIHSNADEPKEEAQKYFREAHLTFPVLRDEKTKLANQFKASKTPHTFVYNSNGDLLYKGGVTSSADAPSAAQQYLREALTDIQAGNKVRTAEARCLGCAISRGENHVW
ncbi:MAG: redoxin domain-containing protein [Pseudobdellovibrionaceae bacterium]